MVVGGPRSSTTFFCEMQSDINIDLDLTWHYFTLH
jgi:hypothetical protein